MATPPPFAYGPAPNFPMTPGNSLPAMAVWLFLVTDPTFLFALDNPHDTTTVPVEDIAAATNLTPQCVQSILDWYTKNANPTHKQAFGTVAGVFQSFAHASDYHPTFCPGSAGPLLQLAKYGTAVDPTAQ